MVLISLFVFTRARLFPLILSGVFSSSRIASDEVISFIYFTPPIIIPFVLVILISTISPVNYM